MKRCTNRHRKLQHSMGGVVFQRKRCLPALDDSSDSPSLHNILPPLTGIMSPPVILRDIQYQLNHTLIGLRLQILGETKQQH